MTRKATLFFLVFLALLWSSPAKAGPFDQCGAPSNSIAKCPIMEEDANHNPIMRNHKFAPPIGEVEIPSKVYFFAGPLCIIDRSVRSTMEGLYAVFSDAFVTPVRVIILLYVCIYAVSFIFGLVNPKDFSIRLIKLTIVWVLITDNCTFYNYLYGGFISASNDLVQILSEVNAIDNKQPPPANIGEAQKSLYKSLDDMFLNVVGVDGLVGLGVVLITNITAGPQGSLNTILTALGAGSMAMAMFRAIATLGIAMAATAFFLLFTPIFLSLYLFQNTKRMFDSWLSMLLSFALQPFIIFTFLVMMRTVIDTASGTFNVNAKDAEKMDINSIIRDMNGLVENKLFQPPLANQAASATISVVNKELLKKFAKDHNFTVKDTDSDLKIQEEFFKYFLPKLLFWFLVNMIMVAFLKEVPNIAQRLSAYLHAPALGSTTNSIAEATEAIGAVTMPGLSREAGGDIVEMIGRKLGNNKAIRGSGMAALGFMGAVAADGALRDKEDTKEGARREGARAGNEAKEGEATRDGKPLSRTGTLGDLLGTKTVERGGPRAEGIDAEKVAVRDGAKVVGVGEADAAARKETVNDNMVKMRATNDNMMDGADRINTLLGAAGADMNIAMKEKPLDKAGDPRATNRNVNIMVQDIAVKEMRDNNIVYIVNGREEIVPRGMEQAFLSEKLAQIDKDMTKAGIMGAKGAAELQESMRLKALLSQRGRVMQSEKDALGATQEALAKLQLVGQDGKPMLQLQQDIIKQVQQGNVAGIQKLTAQLKASKNNALYADLIAKMEKLEGAITGKAMRTDTVANLDKNAPTATPAPVAVAAAPVRISSKDRAASINKKFAELREKTEEKALKMAERFPGTSVADDFRERIKWTADLSPKIVDNALEGTGLTRGEQLEKLDKLMLDLRNSPDREEYVAIVKDLEGLRQQMVDEGPKASEMAREEVAKYLENITSAPSEEKRLEQAENEFFKAVQDSGVPIARYNTEEEINARREELRKEDERIEELRLAETKRHQEEADRIAALNREHEEKLAAAELEKDAAKKAELLKEATAQQQNIEKAVEVEDSRYASAQATFEAAEKQIERKEDALDKNEDLVRIAAGKSGMDSNNAEVARLEKQEQERQEEFNKQLAEASGRSTEEELNQMLEKENERREKAETEIAAADKKRADDGMRAYGEALFDKFTAGPEIEVKKVEEKVAVMHEQEGLFEGIGRVGGEYVDSAISAITGDETKSDQYTRVGKFSGEGIDYVLGINRDDEIDVVTKHKMVATEVEKPKDVELSLYTPQTEEEKKAADEEGARLTSGDQSDDGVIIASMLKKPVAAPVSTVKASAKAKKFDPNNPDAKEDEGWLEEQELLAEEKEKKDAEEEQLVASAEARKKKEEDTAEGGSTTA